MWRKADCGPRLRGGDGGLLVEERSHLARPRRVLQLAQRLRLDLADALARHAELLTDLFERMVGVHPDAEAHAQDALLARGERGEDAGDRFLEVRLHRGVDRDDRIFVLDEIAERSDGSRVGKECVRTVRARW